MIVIDASALAKFVLREEGSSKVLGYLRSGTVSPDLAFKEVANAIWRAHVHGRTSREQANTMFRVLGKLIEASIRIEDQGPYMEEAVRISFDREITVYDSIYVAMAKGQALSLLTSDERQSRVAENEGVKTVLLP